MAVRNNIVVSIDERGSSEMEVIKLSTTSAPDRLVVTIDIGSGAVKATVHPDDLQKALDEARDFLKNRPIQAKTPMAGGLTPNTIKVEDVSSEFSEN